MSNRSNPVVCIGEILIDLIAFHGHDLSTADQFVIREGGAPMNAAIAMARLGLPVRFCGVVGDDPFGQRLQTLLNVEGVDTSSLRVAAGDVTSLAFAWKDARGDGHFKLIRLADRTLDLSDVDAARIDQAAALLVGSVALAAEPSGEAVLAAVRQATGAGVPVVVDINVRPTLWPSREALVSACQPLLNAARVLKLSLDDARVMWKVNNLDDAVSAAISFAPWLIVITDGSRGVAVAGRDNESVRRYPALAVDAIDPTGAGDAFTGGLISRLVESNWSFPTDADIRFAMAAGAIATTKQGAIPALPSRATLDAFLADCA